MHEILWAFFNVFENNSMLNEKWETFLILIQSFLILIVIMRNMDDYFQQVAYSMGYKPEDLLPIDRQVLELQSTHITRGMTQKESEFYINKKMTTLLQRQNRIFQAIQQQIKRRQFTYKLSSDKKSKLHNPTVMKLLEDHEKMMNKNNKYIDTLFKKKTIEEEQEMNRRRTFSNQKKRLTGRSFRSNASSVSSRSNRSKQSVRSNLSAASNRSTASNKERLESIRSKKKEEEDLKRKAYQQKQQEDSKKFLRAMENISRKSQRVKTKTAVSKQIVSDNKKQLDFIKNAEIKDHLERLKFKIQRTEMIRAKNTSKKEQRERSSQGKGLKEMLQEEKKKLVKSKIDEKNKTASLRFQNQQLVKKEAINFNKMMHDVKHNHVKKNRDSKNKEEEEFLFNVQKYEDQRLRTAEIKRNAIKSMHTKERYFTRQLKHDLAQRNIESVNHRRLRETQELRKKIDNRFNQIRQIDQIKQKLAKERQKFKKDLTFQRKSLQVSNYRPKFNSFFDI